MVPAGYYWRWKQITDRVASAAQSAVPDPSVSNKLKASRISSISSSLNPGLSYDFVARFAVLFPRCA